MNVVYSITDFTEEGGTVQQYYDQFKTAKNLEVGEVYVRHPGTWQEAHFEIVHVHDAVALGEEIKGLSKGDVCLFHSTGLRSGWRYQDPRAQYRLQDY